MIKQQYDTILLSVPKNSKYLEVFKKLNFKEIGYTNQTHETEELILEKPLMNRDIF